MFDTRGAVRAAGLKVAEATTELLLASQMGKLPVGECTPPWSQGQNCSEAHAAQPAHSMQPLPQWQHMNAVVALGSLLPHLLVARGALLHHARLCSSLHLVLMCGGCDQRPARLPWATCVPVLCCAVQWWTTRPAWRTSSQTVSISQTSSEHTLALCCTLLRSTLLFALCCHSIMYAMHVCT